MLIGAHVSIAGGVSLAFQRAGEYRAHSAQIFTKTARAWLSPPLAAKERSAFRAEAKKTGIPVVAHGSYLANLGAENPALWEKSIGCVAEELTRCERLGIGQLIVHPGSNADPKRGLSRIAAGIDEVHARTPRFRARLSLEVTAGQGTVLGWRFEHLSEILSLVRQEERISVCLDTCHLLAAGYDIRTPKAYQRMMKEFDRLIGLHRVCCFHLNDSKKPLGCRVDRHEEIGKGYVGLGAFRYLVNDPRFQRTVGVLETPHPASYRLGIRLLRSLVRR